MGFSFLLIDGLIGKYLKINPTVTPTSPAIWWVVVLATPAWWRGVLPFLALNDYAQKLAIIEHLECRGLMLSSLQLTSSVNTKNLIECLLIQYAICISRLSSIIADEDVV